MVKTHRILIRDKKCTACNKFKPSTVSFDLTTEHAACEYGTEGIFHCKLCTQCFFDQGQMQKAYFKFCTFVYDVLEINRDICNFELFIDELSFGFTFGNVYREHKEDTTLIYLS